MKPAVMHGRLGVEMAHEHLTERAPRTSSRSDKKGTPVVAVLDAEAAEAMASRPLPD